MADRLTPHQAEILGHLHAGQRIYIDRRTSASAREANELAVKGYVTMRVEQLDEQSSVLVVELASKDSVQTT